MQRELRDLKAKLEVVENQRKSYKLQLQQLTDKHETLKRNLRKSFADIIDGKEESPKESKRKANGGENSTKKQRTSEEIDEHDDSILQSKPEQTVTYRQCGKNIMYPVRVNDDPRMAGSRCLFVERRAETTDKRIKGKYPQNYKQHITNCHPDVEVDEKAKIMDKKEMHCTPDEWEKTLKRSLTFCKQLKAVIETEKEK